MLRLLPQHFCSRGIMSTLCFFVSIMWTSTTHA